MSLENGDVSVVEPSTSFQDDFNSERETILDVIKEMVTDLSKGGSSQRSMLARSHDVVKQKAPRLKVAARHSSEDLGMWINQGGRWRSFLITVTGLISLVGLTGVAAFLVFFVIATANAIVVALLGSMAAVGACVAIFFAALTAIYIGALSIAVFGISTIALFSIFAVVTAAGWISFWWAIWICLKRGVYMVRGQPGVAMASNMQGVSSRGWTRISTRDGKSHT